MYKVQRISPSALAATEECPRFRPDGKENDAAAEGTLLHAALEKMVTLPKSKWETWIASQEISTDHRSLLRVAAEDLRAYVDDGTQVFTDFRLKMRNGKPRQSNLKDGLYPELEIETAPGRHGYIDLLIVSEGTYTIIDYKFVRNEKSYELQLGAYATYLRRLVPKADVIAARIIAPRLYGDPELHVWSGGELDEIENRIRGIEERADASANNPSIKGNPGDACQYCHWLGTCPYQAESLAVDVPIVGDVERLEPRILLNPETPEERGRRRSKLKYIQAFVDAVKEQDKMWVEANGGVDIDPDIVPGYRLSYRNSRAVLDKERADEVRVALTEKLLFEIEELFEVSDISVSKVVEVVSRKYGYSEKKAKEEVQRVLDSYIKPAGKVLFWTPASRTNEAKALIDTMEVR